MSSLNTQIVASINQTAYQQGEVARMRDAVRNQAIDRARRLRQLLEANLRHVEDPAQNPVASVGQEDWHQSEQQHDGQRQDQREDRAELSTEAVRHGDRLALMDAPAEQKTLKPKVRAGLYRHVDVRLKFFQSSIHMMM